MEEALARLRNQSVDADAKKVSSPASVAESSSSAGRRVKIEHDETGDLAREFDGLNVENDGRISFHGPTSLFQLPSGAVSETASTLQFSQEMEARKERLVNNAWRERAFEQMATMPVGLSCLEKAAIWADTALIGTISIPHRLALVLDPTVVQLCLSPSIYSFVYPAMRLDSD